MFAQPHKLSRSQQQRARASSLRFERPTCHSKNRVCSFVIPHVREFRRQGIKRTAVSSNSHLQQEQKALHDVLYCSKACKTLCGVHTGSMMARQSL